MVPDSSIDTSVAVVGGGVVGAAVARALTARGVAVVLLEAEDELALGASGTNSGILHTGFDSVPSELETRLLLRSAALRDAALEHLGVPVLRCGALLRAFTEDEARAVSRLADAARENGVVVEHECAGSAPSATLTVPSESVTDPVLYTRALAAAAAAGGADIRTGTRVEAIEPGAGDLVLGMAGGGSLRAQVVANCAGLHADEVARLAGDDGFAIYPRKGEFFVFDPPGGEPLERILLPVPTERTKGVLVFPTVDGMVIAGPTAHDQEDKRDWSVRPEARAEVLGKAVRMLPALEGREPVAAYAGLRPAGRGVNYLIGPSQACPGLINVAAIRSTGLSASLGIGEHVCGLVSEQGIQLREERALPAGEPAAPEGPWWRRAAASRAEAA